MARKLSNHKTKEQQNYYLWFNQSDLEWELRSKKDEVIFSSKYRDDVLEKYREKVDEALKGKVSKANIEVELE